MRLVFTATGWEDYVHRQTTDRAMVKRVNRLIDDVLRDPFSGIGKPEPLKHAFTGSWSRRIDDEHRLVYVIDGDDVVIYQARFHYS
ncbi:MAG: Txe/YoeB family addiction module toxin [Pseudonocardia sp.]|nr:Txe/YoeB family addiction module toxin [Pseudonocardia sp.]